MAGASKELLDLTGEPRNPSIIESLLTNKNDLSPKTKRNKILSSVPAAAGGRRFATDAPTSEVLGKVKDFLGIMAKANKKLEQDAQGTSRSMYDIEVLDGNEEECIEMDLLLGVADLQNPEAEAAAEATMGSFQPYPDCINSDTDDNSEDEDSDNSDDDGDHEDKLHKLNSDGPVSNKKPNKRPKIVVLN